MDLFVYFTSTIILIFIFLGIIIVLNVPDPETGIEDMANYYMRLLKYYNLLHPCQYTIPYPIYYINMDKKWDRRISVENQLKLISTNYKRISGIDGYKIKNKKHDVINNIEFYNEYDLKLGEVGCILSHILAINTAHKDGENIVMICEDDISFETKCLIPTIASIIEEAPKDWEILQLVHSSNLHGSAKYKKRELNENGSTLCYLINKTGIKKIIETVIKSNIIYITPTSENFPPKGVADEYLYDIVNTYIVYPSLFIPENVYFPSDIAHEHTIHGLNLAIEILKDYNIPVTVPKLNKRKYTKLDPYMTVWNNTLFVQNYTSDINYVASYNLKNYRYKNNSLNIILDGEPTNLSTVKADLAIVDKHVLLPSCKTLYVPQFVCSFIELNNNPNILVKTNNEKIEKSKFCCFAYSNCNEANPGVKDRKNFYYLLQKLSNNRVDNLGKCYNSNYNSQSYWPDNKTLFKPYKFVVAFENNQLEGYITEKLVMPMISRAIPIYLGAPDVHKYFNTKSFIHVRDFKSFEDCIQYILKVDNDDNLYQRILKEPYFVNNQLDKDLFSPYYGGRFYNELSNILIPYGMDEYIRPCQLYENNFRFLTINNDTLLNTAKESGFFNECVSMNHKNVSSLILTNLNTLDDNDVLVYADSKSKINVHGIYKIKLYYTILETYDMITFTTDINRNDNNVTEKLLNVEPLTTDYRCIDKVFLIKKTKNTLALVKEWANMMNEDNWMNINHPKINNYFDSYILTLLTLKYDHKVKMNDYNEDNLLPIQI